MPETDEREFCVRAYHVDRDRARLVRETSFEAAAVAYAESHPYAADEDPDIRILVREVSSGDEHCFNINLETGEAASCG